ncbi:hypothetical protein [Aureimonas sp. ME7]|uniref:hypothetical protein n=1 Tax=Aureimonas sp. ME7 TaxID=2744252 RepID=UPI0032AEB77E
MAVGLFAVGETMCTAARHRFKPEDIYKMQESRWKSCEDRSRSRKPRLRGTAIGFPSANHQLADPSSRTSCRTPPTSAVSTCWASSG